MAPSVLAQLRRLSRHISSSQDHPRQHQHSPPPNIDTSANVPGRVSSHNVSPSTSSSSPSDSAFSNPSADSFSSHTSSPTRPNSYISDQSSAKHGSMIQNDRFSGQNSTLAPKLTNLPPNTWVHQRILLVRGQVGENPGSQLLDGQVHVQHHNNSFPPTTWKVVNSHFKALLHLQPGPNRIVFTFEPSSSRLRGQAHQSWVLVNLMLPDSAPPLHLAILKAKDSPKTFDAPPSRLKTEGNDLSVAIRKFRMCAYLWQAFTADQMLRHGFGRRSFRFEESWQPGTLSSRDLKDGTMRTQAIVHVITVDKTVEEICSLEYAQQYGPAKEKGKLYEFASDTVRAYFKPSQCQTTYVSCLFLDTKWDPSVGVIRGHAALGGGGGDLRLGIFGSHCLYSYPSTLDEVPSSFTDCTRTDTDFVSNDNNQAGSSWEAANIGIGAHLHETGHLLGCPHQESGIMLRDYTRLHRSFVVKEAYSTATKQQGLQVCKPSDECGWHRLDVLRFRYHPCFRVPSDPVPPTDKTIQAFPVPEDKAVILTAMSGITFVEIYTEGDDICRCFFDYLEPQWPSSLSSSGSSGPGASGTVSSSSSVSSYSASQNSGRAPSPNSKSPSPPSQVRITDEMIRSKLPSDKRRKKMRMVVHSVSQSEVCIPDFDAFTAKTQRIPLSPSGSTRSLTRLASGVSAVSGCASIPSTDFAYPCLPVGLANMANCETETTIFRSLMSGTGQRLPSIMMAIRVWFGAALDGMEFLYDNGATQLFGRRGGSSVEFKLDTRAAEVVAGFYVRAGAWVDGIQIITSTGRKSGFFGNKDGGEGFLLFPPRGYRLAGVRGDVGQWVGSISIVVCR